MLTLRKVDAYFKDSKKKSPTVTAVCERHKGDSNFLQPDGLLNIETCSCKRRSRRKNIQKANLQLEVTSLHANKGV